MQVGNRLSAVFAAVVDNAVAAFGHAEPAGDLSRPGEDAADDGAVFHVQFIRRSDVRLGDEEDVYGRLGVQVVKAEDFIVLVDLFGGDFPRRDLTENTVQPLRLLF